jgi:hypothetical protein
VCLLYVSERLIDTLFSSELSLDLISLLQNNFLQPLALNFFLLVGKWGTDAEKFSYIFWGGGVIFFLKS